MAYKLDIEIKSPKNKVWEAWTSSTVTQKWLAPKANVNFKEGGRYEFFWDNDPKKDSTLGCKLLSIEPKKKMVFQWQGKTEFLDMFQSPKGKPTQVQVEFKEMEGKTKVFLTQKETRKLLKWKDYDSWMSGAWAYALKELKKYCESKKLSSEALLRQYIRFHNEGVKSGDFKRLLVLFFDDAKMKFMTIPIGPFIGKSAIEKLFKENGPTDELVPVGKIVDIGSNTSSISYRFKSEKTPPKNQHFTVKVEENYIKEVVIW